MNSSFMDPPPPEIGSLLACERTIDPATDEFRTRAFERARAELARRARTASPHSRRFAGPRRATVAVAAAASVTLVALYAVAFRAGYRSSLKNQVQPTQRATSAPRIQSSQFPASLPERLPEPSPAVTTPTEPSSKVRAAGRAKVTNNNETYAIEFALLQPAYHAVARLDFTSALTAIAEHRHRFAFGQLAEEREGLRMKALLGLGRRAEAQRAAMAFRERFPRSVLLGRIEGMLDASP
jgi:hypothetical protein